MLESRRRKLTRNKLLLLLDELEAAPGRATTLCLPAGLPLREIEEALDIVSDTEGVRAEVGTAVARSRTGAALFWGDEHRCLVLPPFPIGERSLGAGYDVEASRSLLRREFVVALILVRLGAYGVGVFRGETLVSSKVGSGHIHSRHKKGGTSQHRFQRAREKQMEGFFDRVCTRAQERLGPHVGQLDYVVYGGERNTLLAFRKRCEFLGSLDDRALARVLNVREPRQAALESAIHDVWSSDVVEWREKEMSDAATG
jgi:hypothetical protein